MAIVATVTVVVNTVVVVQKIATTLARARKHRPTLTIVARPATKVRAAQQVLSKAMTPRVKAVATHVAVGAIAATKVIHAKKAPTALRSPTLQRALRQAAQHRRHVSHKARAPKRLTRHKPMINVTCKTAPKASLALTKIAIAVIQSANAVVVVAVVANAVKTRVQALRTKTARQTCNRQKHTPKLTVEQHLMLSPQRLLLQRLCKRTLLQLTWLRHHKPTLSRFRQLLLLRKPQRYLLTLHLQHRLPT
jgi:hypothetical protein